MNQDKKDALYPDYVQMAVQPVEAAGAVQALQRLCTHEKRTSAQINADWDFARSVLATHPAEPVGGALVATTEFNAEHMAHLINRLSVANRRDGWKGAPEYSNADRERAKQEVDTAERNLLEYVRSLAAPAGALVAKAEQDQAHVMPPFAAPASQQDPSEQAFDKLYGEVMNIPCKPDAGWGLIAVNHYKFGHRDARHAAADLVAEAVSGFREGRNTCVCGEPETTCTTHRTDGPCFVTESAAAPADGWPAEIYLNAGDDPLGHFSEYDEVSWCDHPQGESDVRYVRATHQPTPTKGEGA